VCLRTRWTKIDLDPTIPKQDPYDKAKKCSQNEKEREENVWRVLLLFFFLCVELKAMQLNSMEITDIYKNTHWNIAKSNKMIYKKHINASRVMWLSII